MWAAAFTDVWMLAAILNQVARRHFGVPGFFGVGLIACRDSIAKLRMRVPGVGAAVSFNVWLLGTILNQDGRPFNIGMTWHANLDTSESIFT